MDNFNKITDVSIIPINGYLEQDMAGYYLPVHIINSGERDLHNLSVGIKTCQMVDFEDYPIDLLTFNEGSRKIKFENKKVIDVLLKKGCEKRHSISGGCEIKAFIEDNQIKSVFSECEMFSCGKCSYEIKISANELKEGKMIEGSFFSPRPNKFQVLPKNQVNNLSNAKPYLPITINIFGNNELCIKGIKEDSCDIIEEDYLFDKPFDIKMATFNESLGFLEVALVQIP